MYTATEMAQSLQRTGRLSEEDSIMVEESHATDGMLCAWQVLFSKLPKEYQLRAESFVRVSMVHAEIQDIPDSFEDWESLSPYQQLLFSIGLSYYLS